MRTPRLFTAKKLEVGAEITLCEKPAHYLSRVLRLPTDTEIVLFNGDGHDYRCTLAEFSRGTVRAKVAERLPNGAESPLRITLSQALSRGKRMDYCLQKATELGVAAVQLLLTERVELKLAGERLEKRLAHWRGVISSASEQCGRATVPQLRAPIGLGEWLDLPGRRLVFDSRADIPLRQAELGDEVDVAIGPEGGFSEGERESMEAGGVMVVRLGPRILRTETAGPTAIAVMQSMAGDLG